MINLNESINYFVILWTVIDPIGTIPVFIAVTKGYSPPERKKIAGFATLVSLVILIFFMVTGEVLLRRIGVPLTAFQISGGIILFLFALNMIFGDSKPEEEIHLVKSGNETAIFPLATPSIAGPGAIMAVVLLTDSSRGSLAQYGLILILLSIVLLITYFLMCLSTHIHKKIGNSGAIVISKIMGLILASMAANYILVGINQYFSITN